MIPSTHTCRQGLLIALAALSLTGCSQPDMPDRSASWFAEEARERGVSFEYRSGSAGRPLMPEIVGGGVALADVDADGDLDIYLVQADWNIATGSADDADGNRLYLNRGDGRFDVDEDSGAEDRGYGLGVTTGDYDNDGDIDIYVTNYGPNALFRNDGTGHFEEVATPAGVADPGFSPAATFVDLDRDGDLDLFVVNYLNWSVSMDRDCESRGRPTFCSPRAFDAPAMDRLYRNDGDGTFTDVTLVSGIGSDVSNGMGVAPADFNGDGLPDLFVTNDLMVDQLWLNLGDLKFREEARKWGSAVDDHGAAKAGMGVVTPDLDHDDDIDLLVVNFEGETDSLFRNDGGYFVDITARMGIAAVSRRHTRFGVIIADFDNDGLHDLFEANGKVDGDPGAPTDPFAEPNTLFRGTNNNGTLRFEEVRPQGGAAEPLVFTSRGLAMGDLDDDGGQDLVVVNRDGPVHLMMNRVARGAWVKLRLLTASGRDAIGARAAVTAGGETFYGTVQVASSYAAAHDVRLHFGLGDRSSLDGIVVTWVDGSTEAFGAQALGETVILRQGTGKHP